MTVTSSAPIRTQDRKDWRTPAGLFADLSLEFDFDLDVAATAENSLCPRFLKDAFFEPWLGRCFMNPPYGREIAKWVRRASEEVESGAAEVVVALLPAKTDTIWFHDYCASQEVRFIKGRLYFDDGGGRAPFPSMIVVFKGTIEPDPGTEEEGSLDEPEGYVPRDGLG